VGGLRQCGALVLRRLCERSLGRPDEPRLITDEEMAQLVWDSRRLSNDLAGHSLLPCLPMPAWEGWRQWSPERPPTARVLTRRGERGTRRQGGCDEGRTQTLGGVCMDDPVGPLIIERVWTAADRQPAYRIRWTAAQLRRIGQAVREGDQAFLDMIEQAMRRALEAALTAQQG
jgi:hypothetical protein